MEKVVAMQDMQDLYSGIYKGKTVLLTGHTGFKGSWLSLWLERLGAKVIGYSLPAPTEPNHIGLLNLNIVQVIADIRDLAKLNEVFAAYKPDIVFHFAAQALVRPSYADPITTYETNVIGTLKVLEACRKAGVRAIVNITSDKAYENKEWVWGYRESDPMGGYDPYSSSKGCADILASSYRNSFFNEKDYGTKHQTLLATCRAGNVIGGGDWAQDRLICDVMRAAAKNEAVTIRNPHATRPWQHVLEPLGGYLLVGQKLLEGRKEFGSAWNFGPSDDGAIRVLDVLKSAKRYWDKIEFKIGSDTDQPHEANLLKLDCSKAHALLGWKPVWDSETAFEKTAKWYKNFYKNGTIDTEQNLNDYVKKMMR